MGDRTRKGGISAQRRMILIFKEYQTIININPLTFLGIITYFICE
ncbi:hypothetical protein SMU44_00635 [Streptococcus mutans 11VS1]|nr:hypothetical protein SMU44_00635 [Streptococcus mutans 11VS1]